MESITSFKSPWISIFNGKSPFSEQTSSQFSVANFQQNQLQTAKSIQNTPQSVTSTLLSVQANSHASNSTGLKSAANVAQSLLLQNSYKVQNFKKEIEELTGSLNASLEEGPPLSDEEKALVKAKEQIKDYMGVALETLNQVDIKSLLKGVDQIKKLAFNEKKEYFFHKRRFSPLIESLKKIDKVKLRKSVKYIENVAEAIEKIGDTENISPKDILRQFDAKALNATFKYIRKTIKTLSSENFKEQTTKLSPQLNPIEKREFTKAMVDISRNVRRLKNPDFIDSLGKASQLLTQAKSGTLSLETLNEPSFSSPKPSSYSIGSFSFVSSAQTEEVKEEPSKEPPPSSLSKKFSNFFAFATTSLRKRMESSRRSPKESIKSSKSKSAHSSKKDWDRKR